MEELMKWMIQNVPLALVIGVALYKVYTDGKADRRYMMDVIEKQYAILIELAGGKVSDHDDTLMKRP